MNNHTILNITIKDIAIVIDCLEEVVYLFKDNNSNTMDLTTYEKLYCTNFKPSYDLLKHLYT